ncbi:hypothetical protein P6P36_01850 [Clostridium perfringens]|nr:hypothetical protein [Clostridium perfringens]MDK0531117.1 hypothetical protein [Clostridium perfringens]MDM0556540.1 hypothetical protein [Clostridium perfringens]HAT4273435.1 hypothetical protein [Clostridium perfringens]
MFLSTKVHKIADYLSLILLLGLSIITIIYLQDLGIVGKLLTLVLMSGAIRISYFWFLQKLKVWLKPNAKKAKEQIKTRAKIEPIQTLDLQQYLINDLKLQAKNLFRVAMQNQKLNRAEIISIKDYLKNNINDPTLINKKYINEAHFIYSYLKSEYINEETLNCVIKNIFIFANRKAA